MLFATLDPTTRRIRLPRSTSSGAGSGSGTGSTGNSGSGGGMGVDGEEDGEAVLDANAAGARNKVCPPMRLLMYYYYLPPLTSSCLPFASSPLVSFCVCIR